MYLVENLTVAYVHFIAQMCKLLAFILLLLIFYYRNRIELAPIKKVAKDKARRRLDMNESCCIPDI